MTAQGPGATGVELRLFSSGSARGALGKLVPAFERESGHRVTVSYDPGKLMLERIRRGESADVVLVGSAAIDELTQQGYLLPGSARAIGRCGVGAGVRAGAPKPDISTVDAFKRALLAAKTIAYTQSGASGMHFARLIDKLGIGDEVRARARMQPGGLVGEILVRGEAEFAIQQIPELLAVPGVDLVGPLPAELQATTVTAAAIFAKAAQPQAARAFLDFLATPAAKGVFRASGLEPV